MSDLEEDYESEVDIVDSDKEDTKFDKTITSQKSVPQKIQAEIENSSEDDDDIDSDLDIADDDIQHDKEEEDLEAEPENNTQYAVANIQKTLMSNTLSPINSDVDSEDEDNYQKFDEEDNINYISKYHPECFVANSDEVNALSQVIRLNGKISDKNHMTNPILTKYEKTKILGQRTKQLNSGCQPYIYVANNIVDNYLIAQMELKEKKIPVIIRRPISSQKSEYWKLEDLEQIY